MTHPRLTPTLTSGLALGLTLIAIVPLSLVAQPQPGMQGAPLSSGSGAGTGTGEESGRASRFGSGSGPTRNLLLPGNDPRDRTGVDSLRPPRFINPDEAVPRGPGATTTFPDDLKLFPRYTNPAPDGKSSAIELSTVQPKQLEEARRITTPGDRSMALQRIASAAIFSNQLPLAHAASAEAIDPALQEEVPLVRDQRLIAIVTTLNYLAEAHLREGKTDLSIPDVNEKPAPTPKTDRPVLIRRAMVEWARASRVSGLIANPTYRSEMRYRVIDNQAYGSQTVVNEFPIGEGAQNQTATANPGSAFNGLPDRILQDAAQEAMKIERPVWRDRALVSIAQAASASRQFRRGLIVSRMIPQPEVRTDALVKIAEAQARHDDPKGATATYREAALAVAAIPLDDPRAILAGVLIDNLISVGRFEDARVTIVLYPDNGRRLVALGAIAESQGRRGAAETARTWIAREVPTQYQSELYRRVNAGILFAIEQNRSRDLTSNRAP